jgi:tight adherence protein B
MAEIFVVNPALLTVLTFLAVGMAVLGAYSLLSDMFLRDRSRVSQRVDRELRSRQRDQVRKSTIFKSLETGAGQAETLGRPTWRTRLEAFIQQSGVTITTERLLTFTVVTGLALGLVAGIAHWTPVTGLAGALLGASIPTLYVAWKRRRRLNKMMDQLPEAFDLMGRIIRAGQTMA